MRACDKVYCQKSCNGTKKNGKNGKNGKRWAKSYTKKRKSDLMKKGALSGCRDFLNFQNITKESELQRNLEKKI